MKKIALFGLLLFSTSILCFSQIDLNENLVAFYPLDGTFEDFSSYNIQGISNGVIADTGKNNLPETAVYLNGNSQYINCNNNERGITNKLSVSVWIRKIEINTAAEYIVSKYVESNGTVKRGFSLSIGGLGLPTFSGRLGQGGTSGLIKIQSESSIVDGNWHHLLGTVDENEWNFWVDGINVGSFTSAATNTSLACGEILSIGSFAEMGSNYYKGSVDEMRLYNRILNSDEISLLSDISFIDTTYSNNEIYQPIMNISVFPNPANDFINIDLGKFNSGTVEVKLYNVNGSLVKQKYINDIQTTSFSISDLRPGIYICEISGQNFIVREKLVIAE